MKIPRDYRIRPFQPADQEAARALILEGLAERWGELDHTLNRDLDDIWRHYVAPGGAFVVVLWQDTIIATGALSVESPGVMRIERVSVATAHRRCGLGRSISEHLIALARQYNCTRIVVETTDTWHNAIRLYEACGFVPFARHDGDVHMVLDLTIPL